MKWSATVTSLIIGVVSLVAAQDAGVYFTNPILGTVLTAGAPTSITWVVTNTTVPTIDNLELRHGDAGNLALVETVFDKPYQMSFTKYDWMVPSNLTTDTSYVLVATNAAGTSYSAYFTIVGLAPGVTASDFAASSAPATIAAAVSSASNSASASSSVASAVSSSAPVSSAHSVMTTAATSINAASHSASSSTPSTSITLKKAVAVSGSEHLKAGVMSIAGAAVAAALLA